VRFNDHILYEMRSNICLHRSLSKHGLEAFAFSVVEFCDPSVLLAREQVWLDLLFSTFAPALIYNFARDALAPMLGRSHTAETKAAISKAIKGNTNNLGTTQSLSVYVYDSNNVLVDTFPSQSAAIKEYKISKGSIYNYLDSKKLWNNLYYFTSAPLA